MPTLASVGGLIRRNPLSLWFLGLALLGGVRFHLALKHDALQAPEPTTWAWLFGSLLLAAIGLTLLLRDLQRGKRPDASRTAGPTKN